MGDLADLRATLAAPLEALAGWTVSRWAPDLFGRDTDHILNHAFAIHFPESVPAPGNGRQRVSPEAVLIMETTVEVLWAHRLRGDAQVADGDAATNAEQLLVRTLFGILGEHIKLDRLGRRAAPEGWVLGVARFKVVHRYALTA
jgi:hypothetical protein